MEFTRPFSDHHFVEGRNQAAEGHLFYRADIQEQILHYKNCHFVNRFRQSLGKNQLNWLWSHVYVFKRKWVWLSRLLASMLVWYRLLTQEEIINVCSLAFVHLSVNKRQKRRKKLYFQWKNTHVVTGPDSYHWLLVVRFCLTDVSSLCLICPVTPWRVWHRVQRYPPTLPGAHCPLWDADAPDLREKRKS